MADTAKYFHWNKTSLRDEAVKLAKHNEELLEALEEADKTLCILQTNVAHANKTSSKWDGVWQEIENIRKLNAAAIAKAKS